MPTMEQIRLVTVRCSAEGVQAVTSQLRQLASAEGSVAAAAETQERKTLSLSRAYDNIQRKLDLQYKVQQEVAKTQRQLDTIRDAGLIGADRYGQLLALNTARLTTNARAGDALARSTGNVAFKFQQVSYQLNDMVVGLASGQSPFTVLLQQGSQLAGIIPARFLLVASAIGVVAAAAARAASAYVDLDRRQATLANALNVTAGASGQSAASLQKLTESMARFGVSSVADIRAAESELLRFRSVSGSAFGDTLKLAQDLASTGFTDLSSTVRAFGKALSDPVKGLDGLRDAGLRYSPIQEKLISDLHKQGRLQSAQTEILKIAAAQLGGATAMAADTATGAYGRFTNAITLGIERMGQNIAEAVRLKAILDGISAALVKGMSDTDKERQAFVSALEMAQAGQMPGIKGDLISGTLAMGMRRIGTLQPPFNAADWGGFVAQLNEARDRIEAVNVALAKEQREAGLTEVALRILHEQQRAGVTAHSEAGRAISGYVSSVMAVLHTKQATEQIRMQAASAEIEARSLGMSAAAASAYRMEHEALAQARIRGIALSQNQVAAIHKEAEAYRKATEAANVLRLTNDVSFERQLIGLSDINQQIAQRLRSVYGDTDWQAEMNGLLAQQMRLNDMLRQTSDLGRDALKNFISDLMTGKSATEALGGVLNKISSKLMDMAINGLWEAAFPTAAGGLLGFFGIGGGLGAPLGNIGGTGGLLGPLYHSGGIVGSSGTPTRLVHPGFFDVAPRFARGGIAGLGPDEVPIIAHRNEEIVRADDPRHRRNGGARTNSVTLNFAPTIDARGADAEAVARIEYALEKMRREFATNVIKVVNHARSHRVQGF